MKDKSIILEFIQDGLHIKAALVRVPERGLLVCKAVIKHPQPRISKKIEIDVWLYPDHIDVIKDQIISEMKFTCETLLTK